MTSAGEVLTMMEKEMPKLCISPQSLFSSCLYPNSANSSSSPLLARLARRSIVGSATSAIVLVAFNVTPQSIDCQARSSIQNSCRSFKRYHYGKGETLFDSRPLFVVGELAVVDRQDSNPTAASSSLSRASLQEAL